MSDPSAGSDAATKGYVDRSINTAAHVKLDGSSVMIGDLNMGMKRITNVADPVWPQDVVTVNYLELMLPINRDPIGSVIIHEDSDPLVYSLRI